jgi:lysozyme family protein
MADILQNLLSKADLLIVFMGMALLLWRSLSALQSSNSENVSLTQMLAKLIVGQQVPDKPLPSPVVPPKPAAVQPSVPASAKPSEPPKPPPAAPAASDNFNACMAFVWPEEGGFSNDPQDHGGPTNLGVTIPDLAQAGMPATVDDVKALTKPIAAARIYRPFYWNAMHCDELPRGVDLCVFDLGINAGIHEAAKLLQRDVGTATDGVIGPATIAAAHARAAADIIRTFTEERLSFYQSLKQFDRFGRDWTKRTNDCHAAALKMAGEAASAAPLAKTPALN